MIIVLTIMVSLIILALIFFGYLDKGDPFYFMRFNQKGDWIPVWTKASSHSLSYYEIQYSTSKRDYRLITGGLNPEYKTEYAEAINKLNELLNEL